MPAKLPEVEVPKHAGMFLAYRGTSTPPCIFAFVHVLPFSFFLSLNSSPNRRSDFAVQIAHANFARRAKSPGLIGPDLCHKTIS
jgi:hypothetical protein